MTQSGSQSEFTQPLAELTLRGPDGDSQHTFTLRLHAESLVLVPNPAAATSIQQGLAAGAAGVEQAPRLLQALIRHLRSLGQQGLHTAFTPHPLRATAITLAGPYLHLRIGSFDTEYGPGEFDPDQAAVFVEKYQAARAPEGL